MVRPLAVLADGIVPRFGPLLALQAVDQGKACCLVEVVVIW